MDEHFISCSTTCMTDDCTAISSSGVSSSRCLTVSMTRIATAESLSLQITVLIVPGSDTNSNTPDAACSAGPPMAVYVHAKLHMSSARGALDRMN